MHVKMIHDMLEKLSKCAEMEIEKGIENIDAKEMSEVTDMIKDLAEAEYYAKITVAMDKAEYGEDYDYKGAYEHERKGYRSRDSKGRFVSRRNRRMGYEEPIRMWDEEWDDMQKNRDMDKHIGKMYYSDGMTNGQYSSRMQRDSKEGRSGEARRGYMETKEMHKDNSAESKQHKMRELENYMKELSSDVTEMIEGASPEEKNMLKNKMQVLMQKIQ